MKRNFFIFIIIIAVLAVSGIFATMANPRGYTLFIYSRDSNSGKTDMREVRSGFNNEQACLEESRTYDIQAKGIQISYARCGKDCPFYATSERECNQQ